MEDLTLKWTMFTQWKMSVFLWKWMCEIELDQNIATDQNSSPKTKTEAKRSY